MANPIHPPTEEERERLPRSMEKGYLMLRRSIRKPNRIPSKLICVLKSPRTINFRLIPFRFEATKKPKPWPLFASWPCSGETFDLIRMEMSEAGLGTLVFSKVTLDDEPITSQDPELVNSRRNLVVNVEEGRTGHVSFGVGFSTLEKAMMFAEFRQGNFDLMRWRSPHRLQGDGQKFRLRLKLGARSNEAVLALEEPWFLNRRVAAGFELFPKIGLL